MWFRVIVGVVVFPFRCADLRFYKTEQFAGSLSYLDSVNSEKHFSTLKNYHSDHFKNYCGCFVLVKFCLFIAVAIF